MNQILKKTLVSLVNYLDIEYYQGMNSIVGALFASGFNQPQAFLCSIALFDHMGVYSLYTNGFEKALQLIETTKEIFQSSQKCLSDFL